MQRTSKYNWKKIYKDYLSSGMSVYEYAVTHNIPKTTMFYGKQRMEKELSKSKTKKLAKSDAQGFLEVVIEKPKEKKTIQENLNNNPITIRYKEVSVEIDKNFDKPLLKDLLEIIKEVC